MLPHKSACNNINRIKLCIKLFSIGISSLVSPWRNMSVFLDLSRMNRLHWAVAARTTCIFCPYLIGIVLAGFQSRDGLSWLCRAVKRSVEQKIIPDCPTHRVPLDSGCILGCRRCDIFRHRRRLYLSSDSA